MLGTVLGKLAGIVITADLIFIGLRFFPADGDQARVLPPIIFPSS